MAIQLMYFAGCPGVEPLLDRVRAILDQAGRADPVQLVEVQDAEDAVLAAFLGSPTLRIDGRDIEPGADARDDYGMKCRLYPTSSGLHSSPPDEWIRDAIARSGERAR